MTCDTNNGIYKGDDLVDIITVNKPSNTEDITITKSVLQVGRLEPIIENNPVFPYTVSIMRKQSVNLDYENPVYLVIYYNDTNGHENVRKTCVGHLVLSANKAVVGELNE